MVHDWAAAKKYYFLCKSWLSADVGEGLDKTFVAATAIEASSFHNLLVINTMRSFSFTSFDILLVKLFKFDIVALRSGCGAADTRISLLN